MSRWRKCQKVMPQIIEYLLRQEPMVFGDPTFQRQFELRNSIPQLTAWGLISEIGLNRDQFPTAGHLASWAGICPGSFESAGKRLSGKTRRGSAFLCRHLCQAGWAVSTKRDSYLSALFRRLAARRGNKRATMAVGHTILVIAFHVLKRKENYIELGVNYLDQKNADSLRRSLVRRLEVQSRTTRVFSSSPSTRVRFRRLTLSFDLYKQLRGE